jgi:heme/copper-type cytochrome/quinol oxidase subunit 2
VSRVCGWAFWIVSLVGWLALIGLVLGMGPSDRWAMPAKASPDAAATDMQLALLVGLAGILLVVVTARFLWRLHFAARSLPLTDRSGEADGRKRSSRPWWFPLMLGVALLAVAECSGWFLRIPPTETVEGTSAEPTREMWARLRLRAYECRVTYAGPDGRMDTTDDLRVAGELRLPQNETVTLQLEADDGPHRWYLPAWRRSVQLRKGEFVRFTARANVAGTFDMLVVDLSRIRQDALRGQVVVDSSSAVRRWLEQIARNQLSQQLPAPEVQP